MKSFKHITKINLVLISFLFMGASFSFAQSTWKSPDYQKLEYRRVIVLAKTSNDGARRIIEDETVLQLKSKGVNAIPAYSNIQDSDLVSEEAFLLKADALEVDGLLVYDFGQVTSEYRNTASINANLGVPVRIGVFRGFLGTNVPLAGGTKVVEKITGSASFFNRQGSDIQWSRNFSGKLGPDISKLASGLANNTIKASFKDGIF
jgi:hypothetical protein